MSNIRNNRQVEQPRRRFGTTALLLTCALMLTSGFFFAARQHFSSMDFGMKNSRLRKQVDQLESEKRRLMLAREISLSPNEIKKAVKKVGLGETSREPMVAAASMTTGDDVISSGGAKQQPLVARTASVRPTKSGAAAIDRSEKPDRFSKKGTEAE